ncbi:methylmalonyl Co-A mutase-associated GTPase MeaB [Cytobacillus spongiae]|uniref:methylmalonyl Co-A mutase-associated GTPase MeaB n=1 Tax=Cytobacillus spongiae TaxID=2901381 RepID=UPI001F363D97|nr:methylmalonyl Co-A mutase-associated GTPase MeaB [Cytobacillus spongiae]UII54771.1 methylmalonyl Co-A mutase-associated GTPase MeaB [Cytobacillus spongiae]
MADEKKPEWNDPSHPEKCSSVVRKGVEQAVQPNTIRQSGRFQKKSGYEPSIDELYKGVLNGDRSLLARSITLIESNAGHHFTKAQTLLHKLLPHSGSAIRIGITGVPGAGKSTFIEAFGSYLCNQGLKVAVLAVDPSSKLTGGSILGDKTRMETLARNPLAFIRPSPTGGKLGGVHRKTRETMIVCEAAGFDIILVETVGVGQSEVYVRDMVDFFMLLALTGAGDELQGMKKGIMELADAVIINKADGDNLQLANKTKAEYDRILHFLQSATRGWQTKAYTCSALFHAQIDSIWRVIQSFEKQTKESGVFADRRRAQTKEWIYAMIKDQLQYRFFQHPHVKERLPQMENEVISGNLTVTSAVEELFQVYNEN